MRGIPEYIECDGQRYTCYGWEKVSGVPACTIYQRLKRKWDTTKAIFTPMKSMVKRDARRCECGKPIHSEKRDVCMLCHRKASVWKKNPINKTHDEEYIAPRAQELSNSEVLAHVKDWIRVHVGGFEPHGPVIRYSGDSEIGRLYAGRV